MKDHRDFHGPPRMLKLKLKKQKQVKANGWGFPWTWEFPSTRLLVALLALAAATFIAQDIQNHGSFKASDTARFLHSAVMVYSRQGLVWLRTNFPPFCAECARVIRPLAEQGLQKTRVAARVVSQKIIWLILCLKENKLLFVQWVNTKTPDGAYQVLEYFKEQSLFVHENYVMPGVKHASEMLQGVWNDLQK